MEDEKIRRINADETEASTAKCTKRPRGERSTVNDEEVDEFFAILKRLKEAKRLNNGAVSCNEARRCRMMWQPVFTLDDFKEVKKGHDQIDRADERDNCNDKEVCSRSFDLNAEPEIESTSR